MSKFVCLLFVVFLSLISTLEYYEIYDHETDDETDDDISSDIHQQTSSTIFTDIKTSDFDYSPVSITVSPSHLITPNGFGNVTLIYSNATNATANDFIAIYTPSTSADNDYLDFLNTTGSINGSYYNLTLTNMRQTYNFRYFTVTEMNGTTHNIKRGTSNTMTLNSLQPLGGHIALTNKGYSEIRIIWTSDNISLPLIPKVQIGTKSMLYNHGNFTADKKTYNTTFMCQRQAAHHNAQYFNYPGAFYDTLVTDLQPNTTYYYIYGSDAYWSKEAYFTTEADMQQIDEFNYKFIAYGDMGYHIVYNVNYRKYPGAPLVINRMITDEFDDDLYPFRLILHAGDISYGEGHTLKWDEWSYAVEPIANKVAYMISIGNHEYVHDRNCTSPTGKDPSGVLGIGFHPNWNHQNKSKDDSHGECGLPCLVRYTSPTDSYGSTSTSNGVFWYSFNYGYIHYIMMSSEHNMTQGNPARIWLENDLKNVNKTETPFTIFSHHRPLYCSQETFTCSIGGYGEHLIYILEDLLYEYGVDIVITGHVHNYQRSCAVYRFECIGHENGGIIYLMIGTAGAPLSTSLYRHPQWSRYIDTEHFGYGRFKVTNNKQIYFEFVNAEDGKVLDNTTIELLTLVCIKSC